MKADVGDYREQTDPCPCSKPCKDCPRGFQKLAELKAGLVIYRRSVQPENVNQAVLKVTDSQESNNVFIFHNIKDKVITSKDFMAEMEERTISCARCRHIMENVLKVSEKVQAINENDVIGICDHCKLNKQPCPECEKSIKQFFDNKKNENKELISIKKGVREWLSKVKNVFKDARLDENENIDDQKRAHSDLRINQLLRQESARSERELDIKELCRESAHGPSASHTRSPKVPHRADYRHHTLHDESQLKSAETSMKFVDLSEVKPKLTIRKGQITFSADEDQIYSSKNDDIIFFKSDDSKPEPAESTIKFVDLSGLKPKLTVQKGLITFSADEDQIYPSKVDDNVSESTFFQREFDKSELIPKHAKNTKKLFSAFQSEEEISVHRKDGILHDKIFEKRRSSLPDLQKRELYDHDVPTDSSKHFVYGSEIDVTYDEKAVDSQYTQLRKKKVGKSSGLVEDRLRPTTKLDTQYIHKGGVFSKKPPEALPGDSQHTKVETNFKFYFPRKKVVKKIEQGNKSSSELIQEMQGTLQAKAEEMKRKQEEKERKRLLREEKAKQAAEEKRLLAEEKNKAEKEKTEKLERKLQEEKDKQTLNASADADPSKTKDSKTKSGKDTKESSPKTEQREPNSTSKEPILTDQKGLKTEQKKPQSKADELKSAPKDSKAESKGTKAESKDTKSESKETKAESKETRAESKDPKSGSKDPKSESKDPKSESKEANADLKEAKDALKESKQKAKESNTEAKQSKADPKQSITEQKESNLDPKNKSKAEESKAESKEAKGGRKQSKSDSKNKSKEEKATNTIHDSKDFTETYAERKQRELEEMEQKERLRKERQEAIKKKKMNAAKKHRITRKQKEAELVLRDSDVDLDYFEKRKKEIDPNAIHELIKGQRIKKYKLPVSEKIEDRGVRPVLFQANHIESIPEIDEDNLPALAGGNKPSAQTIKPIKPSTKAEQQSAKGVLYALSDRTFIEKGWTMLPTEKVVRKMNVYRMRPAHPEFDWFNHNKNKRLMLYDTGERLAEFDDNGRGRWYYKNERMALEYYDAEELNAQQRFVVYSNGEPDERGRSRPYTVLATFDYLGNGVVFDHSGKIRLKYNQTEGVVLDRSLGPVSHWKWHSLNDPPVLQQVMIDTQMSHKDPQILKMGGPCDIKTQTDNEDMLAIEFDNFIKEKSKKLTQSFKPFQIKMKALKINEHFSLKVLDQASVYLIYRDGTTNLKLNIGMILDHKEIVDTDTAEVGEVSSNMERLPARTDSIAWLQKSVDNARRFEKARSDREHRLRPPQPCVSSDKMTAAVSRPLRCPLLTAHSRSATTIAPNCYCKSRKLSTTNIYHDNRLL